MLAEVVDEAEDDVLDVLVVDRPELLRAMAAWRSYEARSAWILHSHLAPLAVRMLKPMGRPCTTSWMFWEGILAFGWVWVWAVRVVGEERSR